MKTRTLVIIGALMLAGCKNRTGEADAYGNFEAVEVIVSAETSGRILQYDLTEGNEIARGTVIALVDTTLFHLQKAEIDAGVSSVRTRVS
ncbi:MAG: hypothetical protein QUS12_08585, partial [Methanosarcina sp.]|nr:hypothetical protein [Methanosarcina sp.]